MGTMDCLVVIHLLFLPVAVLSAPRVNSPWGNIQGVDKVSREGLPYYGYYGIPYAKPPVGELRFKKPVPYPKVSGLFNASIYGAKCLQITPATTTNYNNTDMDEDCLTLNVFLPNATESSSRKSVMVWIHGGGFTGGDATMYEPRLLVTKGDVIVVTIQYRLGVFGFLSTGSDVSPGNYGLWDQHLALKWVKTNIQAFGGDKDNITIIGESAGSASVAYQVLYPGSKGLFTKAILQSGAATSLWAVTRNPLQQTKDLARKNGCLNIDAMIECLRSMDSRDLLLNSLLTGTMAYQLMSFTWVPSVDGDFVKDDPQILMRDKQFLNSTCIQDIDVMIGINNNEGAYMLSQAFLFDSILNYTFATDMFKQNDYDNDILTTAVTLSLGEHNPQINDVINVAYTYPRPPPQTSLPQQQVFDSYGDPGFVVPGILFARTHASLAPERKCYFYHFDHFPSFTGSNPVKGMTHAQDILYLFSLNPTSITYFGNDGTITQAEYELSDTFVKFIAEFAKNGDPNRIIEPKLGQRWPPFELESKRYLSFTTNMSVGSDVYGKRASLWLDMIPYLEDIWKQPMTTTPPIVSSTSYTPRWFHVDRRTTEIIILAQIVVLCVVVAILLLVVACMCCRRKSKLKF